MAITPNTQSHEEFRQQLEHAIDHLEHILPAQAPIKDFVHHNTLHGFQHLTFPEALKSAREINGSYGYESEKKYREYFANERITIEDLTQALNDNESLEAQKLIAEINQRKINNIDIYLACLLHPLNSITGCQLSWQIDELDALHSFQPDISENARENFLKSAFTHGDKTQCEAINNLWRACLKKLNLQHFILHPEDLVDLDPERAEAILKNISDDGQEKASHHSLQHKQVHKEAKNILGQLLRKIGHDTTLRGFLLSLTGVDILDDIRSNLQSHIASYLDQGMSAWHNIDREKGFYTAWKQSAGKDLSWVFDQLPEWQDEIQHLPTDPVDTIILQLTQLGIPESHWVNYLEQLALELPGWSGMFLWRQKNPGYDKSTFPVNMLDYLAVRLVLERFFAQRLCRQHWQLAANVDVLRWYFRRRRSEFFVRYTLFNERMPEYLATLSQRQLQSSLTVHSDYQNWKQISDMLITWQQSHMSGKSKGRNVFQHGWQLFRLAQHLGLCAFEINELNNEQLEDIFSCINLLDDETRGFIWLQAYEHHYREQLFNALVNNQNRGRWQQRNQRPESQIVFCMDDREESIRRHLEEINPNIETLGAAGFFGVAINWKGLDDKDVTPLCPVVVTPAHQLNETPDIDQLQQYKKHQSRQKLRLWLNDLIHQETRRSILSPLLITITAPLTLLALTGKTFSYLKMGRMLENLRNIFDLAVKTHVSINAKDTTQQASVENPQQGFTDNEQADRVENFLRTIGLTSQFSNFVIMMGHGSSSQNNPHLAAYDCGACSGRHGGPNARVFAAIANRPEIRNLLKQRNITIPDDTWFLGAEHNTCDETINWYDSGAIPESLQTAFKKLNANLSLATQYSAHERCRRLASAPKRPSLKKALHHIVGRAYDFSQARPELGHATNAAAFIGRRSMSQGAFFDRRVFLISYDPTKDDDEGHIVENILLAAGPVGAGINLEYYFSTVNNEQYGSGSKITHNVTGLFAVMDGTSSDLRTGLPKQMIEIHEAMRLQVVVEAKTETLSKIYSRQPALQELVGNGWLLLSAKDPESEAISVFIPEKGFIPWDGQRSQLPQVNSSTECYDGQHQPLPPVLIKQEAANV
ncbi:MAG: DUF2309 domain-containing protein [Gammaproteobacteria bacterium]|nr:DUF2309 domain-containing protein [Gammaproteobacteria bacterium]MCW9056944.1 DUF2309 domain-containing protein [Gammaproteobacteria bacterium]